MEENEKVLKSLNESFGSFRAEWLQNKIFQFFEAPHYFSALQDRRPCVLEGGRGTGKTTLLKGLSYEGFFQLNRSSLEKFDTCDYIGIYHKVNTNHVRAFKGGGVSDDLWTKIFSHYFNIVISYEVLQFLSWYKEVSGISSVLSKQDCKAVARSLGFDGEKINSFDTFINEFKHEMYVFQSEINNLNPDSLPKLSLAGDPLKVATDLVLNLPQFKGKFFYFLIDEYENYEDYQQVVINSLIKHASDNYIFKIGVRELGWRVKHTLNREEQLYDPADYILINIENYLTKDQNSYDDFAKKVCQHRIANLTDDANFNIENSLPQLSSEEEAILLGVEKTEFFIQANKCIPKRVKLTSLYKYYLGYWANKNNRDIGQEYELYKESTDQYNVRYDNYKYSLLFGIKKGRGASGIQKYYSGWDTLIKVSYGNIRYLMELVHKAFEKHIMEGYSLSEPISAKNQTLAAQDCGLKNLMEFEGFWKNGAQITKLLLGFGRIFQLLAQHPDVAPEKNQFTITDLDSTSELQEIINASVMNLALIRVPGTKLNTGDTRATIYMIHPLYSPYFQFSFRKKRKIEVKSEDIILLLNNQSQGMKKILGKSWKSEFDTEGVPQQMSLFSGYFNG